MNRVTDTDSDGRSTRWAAHRAERRADLCRAARRAVHHRGPDLSMDEMAAAMGTSKSIVYRYFTDKSGLQAAVGIDVLDEFADALASAAQESTAPRDQVAAMVRVYVEMLTHSPNVYRFVTRPETQPSTLQTFLSRVRAFVAEPLGTILAGAGRDSALADLWAAGMVGFVRGAGEEWLAAAPRDRRTPDELTAHLTSWLWWGAARPDARPGDPTPAEPLNGADRA